MSSTCEQQLMELQELYDSQQLLTEELSNKLDRTEVVSMLVHYDYHIIFQWNNIPHFFVLIFGKRYL